MLARLAELISGMDRRRDTYSRALQAARLRASYQRAYFAPALFNLIPVATDQIASLAVDAHWRLYYNDGWLAAHTVEENAAVLIHEVSHLLREHDARKQAAGVAHSTVWNTAADCEINDDLLAEGLPLPDNPPRPGQYGLAPGQTAETYYRQLVKPQKPADASRASVAALTPPCDCGSGAHGERRPWELTDEDARPGGTPGVDPMKARLVRRDVAQRILDNVGEGGDVPLGWRRWAHTVLTPQVDYLSTIRYTIRKALRDCTVGRYDRTYRRPHRRQACYGEFIMPTFFQPRPRPGFLIDTSRSMEETQLARAVAELGGLMRQLGYGADVLVACCDAAVHQVKKVFNSGQLELYGGGGTDLAAGLRWFTDQKRAPIDLLVIVSDCQTTWPPDSPPFPVITIRVGDGAPPPWGDRGANKIITIDEPRDTPARQRRKP
jgi:predicted metal-dependent peptidase